MAIELIPAEPGHLSELARICHLAFNTLHERHRVPPDVPTEEVGRLIIGGVIHRPDYKGMVAIDDGQIVGSNFLLMADEVCGVGPITVDPTIQSRGVGRALMRWVIDEARRQRGAGVQLRLFQEAVNTTSLSLYTSVGFQWRDSAALMRPEPAAQDDPSIRPLRLSDLPEVERLSGAGHGFSRGKDALQLLKMELPGFIRERDGRATGYQISTLFGHAAGETNEDLLALASHTARHVPAPMSVVIVPLSQGGLFSAALSRGFRVLKVLSSMSVGMYRAAPGPAMPSIQC